MCDYQFVGDMATGMPTVTAPFLHYQVADGNFTPHPAGPRQTAQISFSEADSFLPFGPTPLSMPHPRTPAPLQSNVPYDMNLLTPEPSPYASWHPKSTFYQQQQQAQQLRPAQRALEAQQSEYFLSRLATSDDRSNTPCPSLLSSTSSVSPTPERSPAPCFKSVEPAFAHSPMVSGVDSWSPDWPAENVEDVDGIFQFGGIKEGRESVLMKQLAFLPSPPESPLLAMEALFVNPRDIYRSDDISSANTVNPRDLLVHKDRRSSLQHQTPVLPFLSADSDDDTEFADCTDAPGFDEAPAKRRKTAVPAAEPDFDDFVSFPDAHEQHVSIPSGRSSSRRVSLQQSLGAFWMQYNETLTAGHLGETRDAESAAPDAGTVEQPAASEVAPSIEGEAAPAAKNDKQTQAPKRRGRKQQDGDDANKPYKCTQCNQSFRRMEHLKRHERSVHSNEKPYTCDICSKVFSRSDNLSQHRRTHGTQVNLGVHAQPQQDELQQLDVTEMGANVYHHASAVSSTPPSSNSASPQTSPVPFEKKNNARKRKRTTTTKEA